MASANPYLNFAGNCADAFDFYRSVFGGEFSNVSKFSDMPADDGEAPAPELADQVMHIALPLGDSLLMGSDVPEGMGTVTPGSSTYVCIEPDTVEDGRRIFDRLAEGGEVEMPYESQFWGDYFGSCSDRYDIKWMVVVADPDAEPQG